MLIAGDPKVALRVAAKRAVMNCVFWDDANLLPAEQHRSLAHVAHRIRPDLSPGVVETGSVYAGGAVAQQLLTALQRQLESYGFIQEALQVKDFDFEREIMTTRGAVPHADCYNSAWHWTLFWVYVLEGGAADLTFPNLGMRVPLQAGRLIVFDPCQPHGVLARGKNSFRRADFPEERRQHYVSGSLRYTQQSWEEMGVPTTDLDPTMVDITRARLHARTGHVQINRRTT